MADVFENDTYFGLMDKLGPEKSLLLLEKLNVDLRNTRRGMDAALSAQSLALLKEPSHVMISLAGVLGANTLLMNSRQINELANIDNRDFPVEKVRSIISDLDRWLEFLKAENIKRGPAR